MKKYLNYIIMALFIFCFSLQGNALEYKTGDLIKVDSLATVDTDVFNYQDFMYKSNVDNKGNTLVVFKSLENKTEKEIYVSINILLFDENQKNIGFLTYCSSSDYSSNYSKYQLPSQKSTAFSIYVTDKYFVEGKKPADVRYISVLDENKYCTVGGYTKYDGLTVEEITGREQQTTAPGAKKENAIIAVLKSPVVLKTALILGGIIVLIIALVNIVPNVITRIKANKPMDVDLPDENAVQEQQFGGEMVDLSYSGAKANEDLSLSTISIGKSEDPSEDIIEDNAGFDVGSMNNSNDNGEESDLTKMFK